MACEPEIIAAAEIGELFPAERHVSAVHLLDGRRQLAGHRSPIIDQRGKEGTEKVARIGNLPCRRLATVGNPPAPGESENRASDIANLEIGDAQSGMLAESQQLGVGPDVRRCANEVCLWPAELGKSLPCPTRRNELLL